MSEAFRMSDEAGALVIEIDRPQAKNSLKLVEMEELGALLAGERVQSARCRPSLR